MRSRVSAYLTLGLICFATVLEASEPALEHAALSPDLLAVPQNILGLAHTPEVQLELKLDKAQLEEFESELREIDVAWWPARILPANQQRKIVADLETKLIELVERVRGKAAVERLRQIELQSQSARAVMRPEVIKYLRLEPQQVKKLKDLFAATDEFAKDMKPGDTTRLQQLATAQQGEPAKALAILQPTQVDKLRRAFGAPMDTTKLERIYPFAPELVDSGLWTNEQTAELQKLRGKVVLLHFYAFQCHNCVANFKHYKRWDETLSGKGVQVIGIQTPETSAESDPEKVTAAASKEEFHFPVLIDLERKNWNAWGNTMWPTVYVIDKNGYIRFWWQGELNWEGATVDKKVEAIVDKLLQE